MASSVQFIGIDAVMDAFESRKVDAWGLFQNKQFIHKGIGAEDLESFLEILKDSGSNATYTIKIYEDAASASDIKEKTPCDGSYNFKLNGPNEGVAGTGYFANRNSELEKRIKELEEIIKGDDEEEDTIGAVVFDVIRNPDKAAQWAIILKDLFSGKPAQPQQPAQQFQRELPATMGNIKPPVSDEEKTNRLIKVLTILESKDPDILIHLEKLADISEKNPGQFKFLLSMLNTL